MFSGSQLVEYFSVFTFSSMVDGSSHTTTAFGCGCKRLIVHIWFTLPASAAAWSACAFHRAQHQNHHFAGIQQRAAHGQRVFRHLIDVAVRAAGVSHARTHGSAF